ncbi:MAG TPA: V-type ATPase subunit [Spirochaetia bacterium]|nr:V-type ATPase subunit [Spirochaetia bacterium]
MSGYDYLNARIRAMSRFLIPNDVFDQILAADGEDILIDVLLNSPYGPILSEKLPVESGRVVRGLTAAESALREGLFDTFTHIEAIALEGQRRLLGIQLNRWDVMNVLSLLRGVAHNADREDIVHSMIPAGEFHPAQLAELAAEHDIKSVADSLTTAGYAFAHEVRRAVREFPSSGGDFAALETRLYTRYYTWALESLNPSEEDELVLRDHMQLQIDLVNVISTLKQVAYRSQKRPIEAVERIPGGKIRNAILEQLLDSQSVEYALEVLDQTHFSPAIERGILVFGQTNRLSVLERFLEQVVIVKGMNLFRGDPLNIGVPLGFIWRKVNEYLNLRMLLRGKRYHLPANAIREELLLV